MADWNKKSKNECWKSSVNRFCKYCKCWVADNKASWAGHEQGSRHKKAVEDKLMEMKRQAVMTQKHGQVGFMSCQITGSQHSISKISKKSKPYPKSQPRSLRLMF